MPRPPSVGALYQMQALLKVDHRMQEASVAGRRPLAGSEELEILPPLLRGHLGGNVLRGGPCPAVVRTAHHVEEIDVPGPVVVHEIIEKEHRAAGRIGNQRGVRGRLSVRKIRYPLHRPPGPAAVGAAADYDVDVPAPFEVSAGRHPLVYRRYQTAVRSRGYGRDAVAGDRPGRVVPVHCKEHLPGDSIVLGRCGQDLHRGEEGRRRCFPFSHIVLNYRSRRVYTLRGRIRPKSSCRTSSPEVRRPAGPKAQATRVSASMAE